MTKQGGQYEWPAIGNERAIEFLERSLKNGQTAQSYIFIGPEDLGKATIALAFARNLQGKVGEGYNSDLIVLETEEGKKSISIEAVREFIKSLGLSSFLDSYKVGIIKEADLMSDEAKSALLKTLEEPRDKVVIILLVRHEEDLPETILSRSQKIYFSPVPAATIYDYLIAEHGAGRGLAKDLAGLALGRPLRALHYLEDAQAYKQYLERAEAWLELIRQDENARLKALDHIFTDRSYSKQATEAAQNQLDLLESLMRDLMLLILQQDDRIQHSALKPALIKSLASLPGEGEEKIGRLLGSLKLIAQGREYLAGYVNPRLVLEQLCINL